MIIVAVYCLSSRYKTQPVLTQESVDVVKVNGLQLFLVDDVLCTKVSLTGISQPVLHQVPAVQPASVFRRLLGVLRAARQPVTPAPTEDHLEATGQFNMWDIPSPALDLVF